MNPLTNNRIELSGIFQVSAEPFRGEWGLSLMGEYEGIRAGALFSRDLWSPEPTRASIFFQVGYRHYFGRHHALQADFLVGGDVIGTALPSTLVTLTPAYVWFPNENQYLGLSVFARIGAEISSMPVHQAEDRPIWGGGLALTVAWPVSNEDSSSRARRIPLPVSPERCEEIHRQYRNRSTYAVTTIYFDGEAVQEADYCLNQTRRN